MKSFIAALLFVGVATFTVLASPGTASACPATGTGGVDDLGAWIEAYCSEHHPGAPPVSEEDRWVRYCSSYINASGVFHPYEEGAWVEILYLDPPTQEQILAWGYNPTGEYGILRALCHEAGGGGDIGGDYLFTITPPVPVDDLRDAARARIDILDPPIASNPPFDGRFAIVHLDTWFWLEDGYWQTISESEGAGFVVVEVTARPDKVDWVFSNGESATCYGPGVPWSPGAATDCSHTFTVSSDGESDDAFAAEATVTWIFSWELNGAPLGDFGPPFLATTNFEIQVGEIQAIES